MLTPRRQQFATNYALTGNGTESAIQAGYAESGAHTEANRLLRNAEVAAAVQVERERIREITDLCTEDVIRGLREIAEDVSAPHAARVSAWKTLGQHLGMFEEQLRIQHTVNIDTTPLQKFTISELLQMRDKALQAAPEAIEAEVRVLDQ